jgi:hypothetical protein
MTLVFSENELKAISERIGLPVDSMKARAETGHELGRAMLAFAKEEMTKRGVTDDDMRAMYLCMAATCFVMSLANEPHGGKAVAICNFQIAEFAKERGIGLKVVVIEADG